MAAPIKLFIVNGKLVKQFNARSIITDALTFFAEDTGTNIELHFLEENPVISDAVPWVYVAPGGTTQLGIGRIIDVPPTEGTFTITDPAASQTTAAIAYNASAAAVQSAMRAALTTNYSVCVVSGPAGGPWTVDRVTLTDVSGLQGNGDFLWPQSFVSIAQNRTGTAGFSKLQSITLMQKPGAFLSDWDPLPAAAVTITSLQAGTATTNSIQRIKINPDAYAGTFSVTADAPISLSAGPIAYNIDAAALATLLATAFGTGKEVTVTSGGIGIWDVEFSGEDVKLQAIPTMTGNAAGLKVPVGLKGTLDLNQPGIIALLNGAESVSAWLEVNNWDPNKRTLLQRQVTVRGVVLDNAAVGALSLPTFPTLAQVLDLIKGTPSAIAERGRTPLDLGVNEGIVIEFTVPKTTEAWHFYGMPYIRNTDTGEMYPVSVGVVSQDENGAVVNLSGAPENAISELVWHAVSSLSSTIPPNPAEAQPLNAFLSLLAELTAAANKFIYLDGTAEAALGDLTATGRALLALAVANKGDLIVATGAGTFAILPVGADDQVIAADSAETTGLKYVDQTGGGSSYTWTVVTSNATDAQGDRRAVDTSGGPVTRTLPATPAAGDSIRYVDPGLNWAGDNLTIARNGELINGAAADFVCNVDGDEVECIWIGGSVGWRIN